ncbi:MAG: GNAT family N-acetyltransferase [Dehalococcoidia bacterium]|nr:GNAT family N-acetyltransferase [Dehalococcoidia bacterium]
MTAEVAIRLAGEADARVLAEIERSAPIVVDGREFCVDRGDDYFAAARLMEEATVLLAEVDGVPAGVFCGARHRAPIGGKWRRLLYVHHARILPRFQRMGLGGRLVNRLMEICGARVDSQYWYISRGNGRSQAFAARAPNRWSFGPRWLHVDVRDVAGASSGRPATRADAGTIVPILNESHVGEEMFPPYTEETLAARLGRAPELYGWSDVRLLGGAVLGVWREGEWVSTRLRDSAGRETASRGGLVMDYGCQAGAEADLEALIRGCCGELAALGWEDLSMFTSVGSRLAPVLCPLAGAAGEFDFWTPAIREPAGAARRGLYVDPVYF